MPLDLCPDPAYLYNIAENFYIELLQKFSADTADGNPRSGLPGAGPLQNISDILEIVFQGAGKICMTGAGICQRG